MPGGDRKNPVQFFATGWISEKDEQMPLIRDVPDTAVGSRHCRRVSSRIEVTQFGSRPRRRMAMLGTALALAALAGCGSGSPSAAESGYVGTVQGTDAFVAIVSSDAEAVVYICDGDDGISEWFEGSILDPRELSLTNEAGASVQAVYEGATWEGAVTLGDGSIHAFTAVLANDGAGIYKVDDEAAVAEGVWAAWVVDNDGNERGAFLRSGVLATPTPRSSRSAFAVRRQATDGTNIIIVEEEPMGSSNA